MLEILILAVIGTALAGLWDLKTTEVPDQLPYALVIIGIGYWMLQGLLLGNWYPLYVSLAVGTTLLVGGLILYKKGQWGGADAWILAAVGYMIPVYDGVVFIIPYLLNFVLVSIVYTVVYALAMGLRSPSVFRHVAADLKKNAKIILATVGGLVVFVVALSTQLPPAITLLYRLVPLIFALLIFWRYAVVIEKRLFRRRVPTSRLRVGDVIDKGNWIGLTRGQIKALRKQKRFVTIKDGMRFVPVFAIALVLTLLYGNVFLMVLG